MPRNSHLKGYKIPNALDRVITKLFADDTTVYLMAEDKFEDLQVILDKWCAASSTNSTSVRQWPSPSAPWNTISQ
jgi:hypothetical protein